MVSPTKSWWLNSSVCGSLQPKAAAAPGLLTETYCFRLDAVVVSGHPAHILFDDVTGPVEADFKPVSASWGPLNLDEHLRLVFQERKRDVWQPSNRDVWPRDQRARLEEAVAALAQ